MKKVELIAGPCSVESLEQLHATAQGMADVPVDFFRGGIWKPRTRPGNYEGIGEIGIHWMLDMRETYGFKLITEVANAHQAQMLLHAGFDALWLGARTTVNPFYVQEIAEALRGVSIPIYIKNPINPDLALWLGAIERVEKVVQGPVIAIHRGFSSFHQYKYRNQPQWTIPLELKQLRPDLRLICDPSHIAGDRSVVSEVAQHAMDLQYDGLMIEVHARPEEAKSDAAQQLTPNDLKHLLQNLIIRRPEADALTTAKIESLRGEIDRLDEKLILLLADRMNISSTIGQIKAEEDITILQPERWNDILARALAEGNTLGLSDAFIREIFNVIHQESINRQLDILRQFIHTRD